MAEPPAIEEAIAFEQRYADASGVAVEWLRQHCRAVMPCDCGDTTCTGWASVPAAVLDAYKAMGRVPQTWSWPPGGR